MGKSTKKSTSNKKSSSASAGNPPPTSAPPTTLDAVPAVAPSAAPAVPPAAPARLSARQQNLRKKQQEQQQVVPAPPPPQSSKTAKKSAKNSKTAATPKKTRYHPGHTIKFPPTAPIHHRFLCPYNSKPAKGNKPCLSYFSKRYDLTRHVLAKHHNNARGFGAKERDFYGCGPFTVNELRRRGVTETIVARKSVKGEKRVLAGVMGPEVKAVRAMGEFADGSQTEDEDGDENEEGEDEEDENDDEEDENDDEEMEDAGVEYLSDGDDKVDRDPPRGRKDDGNDGDGDGHASASLIAVA